MLSKKFFKEKFLIICCLIGFLGIVVIFVLTTPSMAMQQDLGRHIKFGEIILRMKMVPKTNFFSYTYSNFPFVNHHWLSEVVFYLLDKSLGLWAIFVLKFFLVLSAVGISFYSAFRLAGFKAAILSGLIFLPFVLSRLDERPELFGFLFFCLLFYLLFVFKKGRRAFVLPILAIMLFWTNLHITFVFGLFLIGIFALRGFWISRNEGFQVYAFYPMLFLASFSVTLINPNGLRGALYPFSVFSNYGYRIIENQNLFFLVSRIHSNIIPYFFLVAGLLACSATYVLVKEKKFLVPCLILITFLILGFVAMRNLSFFGFVGIPIFALILKKVLEKRRFFKNEKNILLGILIIILIIGIFLARKPLRIYGIAEYGKDGLDFILTNGIKGNVFNNFDIGGYLDYRLYPSHRVFIDNRPEAYPKEFFGEYIKIQEDFDFRKKAFKKYGIETVIFGRTDITPWAQEFLKQMIQDGEWQLRYADNFLVVFTKV